MMNYPDIMKNITSKLTGNVDKDVKYLQKQIKKYKNHKLSTEIIRECSRLIIKIKPPENKDEISSAMNKHINSFYAELDEVMSNIVKRNYQMALQQIEILVEKVEKNPLYLEDTVTEYYSFNNFFEEIMYMHKLKPSKRVHNIPYPYSEVYYQYGVLLLELQRPIEANKMLEKAIRWNPMSAKIYFEYGETFKILGNMERFLDETKIGFDIAYSSKDLARAYRNMGFYLIEKQKYDAAAGCYVMSLQYDKDSTIAQYQLNSIFYITDGNVTVPTLDEFDKIAQGEDIPCGPNKDVVCIVMAYAEYFLKTGQIDGAKHLYSIAYDLSGSDGV